MSAGAQSFTPKMRPLSARKNAVVAVVEVGFSKTVCVIARLEPVERGETGPTHRCRVLGIGHQRSRGVKGGLIVDMEAAERVVRAVIDSAERMAGVTVQSAVLAIAGGRIASRHFMAEIGVGGRAIQDGDVNRAMAAAVRHGLEPGRAVLHALPTAFRLDGGAPVRDAQGLVASRLSVDMHVASVDAAAARNLMLAAERGHVEIEALVAAPYAAGLSVLDPDETELGVVVFDCGGGTTSAAVFAGGHLQHVDAVAVGGHHVTMDLARGLSMRLDDAERLKGVSGSCFDAAGAERDMIAVPQLGSDERAGHAFVPRSHLTRIIRPRVEEILELLRDRIRSAGFGEALNRGLVLTGGASQLAGLAQLAQGVASRKVRLGRPTPLKGMPESAHGPAFAAVSGLLIYPQLAGLEFLGAADARFAATGGGYFARVGRWLRESF